MSNERNPYAPPKEGGEARAMEGRRRADRVLRLLGAACMVYLLIVVVAEGTGDGVTWMAAMALWGAFCYGFVRGGMRWHVVIAIFMVLSVCVQGYFTKVFLDGERVAGAPALASVWWGVAKSAVPTMVALVCAVVLVVRGVRG